MVLLSFNFRYVKEIQQSELGRQMLKWNRGVTFGEEISNLGININGW